MLTLCLIRAQAMIRQGEIGAADYWLRLALGEANRASDQFTKGRVLVALAALRRA